VTNAYALVDEVKARMSQDAPNMGSGKDQSIADKILEVSRDIDRKVALKRGDLESSFSFLADQPYGRQVVSLSSTPRPGSGALTLFFKGSSTTPIAYDADAAAFQSALDDLATVGAGNSVASGNPGGPWTIDFAGSLSGPQPAMSGYASVDTLGATVTVQRVVTGVASVPSERRFVAVPDLHGAILPIHACLEVVGVTLYAVNGRGLTEGTDYMTWPLNGTPIEALKFMSNVEWEPWSQRYTMWQPWPATYGVTARWGYSSYVLEDVRETCIIEVIRSLIGDVAGNDDRLGTTPFGSVVTAKAFTSKFRDLVEDYGCTLW
jgi:hypothetical protein